MKNRSLGAGVSPLPSKWTLITIPLRPVRVVAKVRVELTRAFSSPGFESGMSANFITWLRLLGKLVPEGV